jgi:hypothetical protein
MSKKGMEMSINLVVGLILGIAMLSAGILLFSKIVLHGNNTQAQVDEQTKNMIDNALDTGEPIYVPTSNVEVKRNSASFWIGIRNTGNTENNFMLNVVPVNPVPAGFVSGNIAFEPSYIIKAKENQIAYVVVNMKGITQKVTLKVTITTEDADDNPVAYGKPKLVTIQP